MKKIGVLKSLENRYRERIKEFCEKEGFEIVEFEDIDTTNFELNYLMLITDNEELVNKIKVNIPLVYIGDHISCLESGACYQLSEKFNEICLRGLVDVVYHGGILDSFSLSAIPVEIKKEYKITNDIFNVDKIVYSITRELIYFFRISDIQKLRIGLSEILTNAIEHGNLEISGNKKFEETEKGTYMEFLKKRLLDSKYKDRYVKLFIEMNKEEFRAVIEDMGQGFDVSSIDKEFSPEDLLKLHGRGILITKMYFDEIKYNEKGNIVTLVKKVEKC